MKNEVLLSILQYFYNMLKIDRSKDDISLFMTIDEYAKEVFEANPEDAIAAINSFIQGSEIPLKELRSDKRYRHLSDIRCVLTHYLVEAGYPRSFMAALFKKTRRVFNKYDKYYNKMIELYGNKKEGK